MHKGIKSDTITHAKEGPVSYTHLDVYKRQVGEVGNAKCGDIMKMYLKIENGVIEDVKFKTFGGGAAIATSSMATEMIKGKTVEDALKLTNSAVVEALEGLPPVKIHCSVLAEQAIKTALADYYTPVSYTHL